MLCEISFNLTGISIIRPSIGAHNGANDELMIDPANEVSFLFYHNLTGIPRLMLLQYACRIFFLSNLPKKTSPEGLKIMNHPPTPGAMAIIRQKDRYCRFVVKKPMLNFRV